MVRLSSERKVPVFKTVMSLLCALVERLSGQSSIELGCRLEDLDGQRRSVHTMGSELVSVSSTNHDNKTTFDLINEFTIEPKAAPQTTPGAETGPLFEIGMALTKGQAVEDLAKGSDWAYLCLFIDTKNPNELLLTYRTDAFSREQVLTFGQQFCFLVQQICENPEARVKELSLVCPEHREILPDPAQILAAPTFMLLREMLAESAKSFPDLAALSSGDRTMSYRELDRVSDLIAQTLVEHGASPGRVVAVKGQKSFGLIAAILGVVKSGAVLLNIDQQLPARRQASLMKLAKVGCLINVAGVVESTDGLSSELQVDAASAAVVGAVRRPQSWETLDRGGDDAAYIFFTSGTTGEPKAILGSHKGLAHFLNWQRSTFQVGPGDRHAQLIGLAFDVVLRDIFLPLVSGATLCLPTTDLGGDRILEWMESEKISVFHAVPSLVESWIPFVSDEIKLGKMRYIFFAGEPLTESLLGRWRTRFGNSCQIANFYGPTETTLAKLYYLVPQQAIPGVQPVGKPQPYCQALVLNGQDKLCGIGEPGEIVIRTSFMSHGYLNANSEQNAKFITNPFRKDGDDRCYRTGDMGQFREDGSILLVGRKDHQIKISGQRVELGEIEAAILRQAEVNQAVVLAPKVSGHYSLVAFVLLSDGKKMSEDELLTRLMLDLPGYMIPSSVLFLPNFPLTPNGKVDRAALLEKWQAAKNAISKSESRDYSPRQKELLGLWASVLGRTDLDGIKIESDFFRCGGSSLFALILVASIRRSFNVRLDVIDIFRNPTLEKMAAWIERKEIEQRGGQSSPSDLRGDLASGPLSYEQDFWWSIEGDARASLFRTTRALGFSGRVDIELLEKSLKTLVGQNASLRTSFRLESGKPIQTIGAIPERIVDFMDLSNMSPDQESSILREKATGMRDAPTDLLGESKLFEVVLLRLRNNTDIMLMRFPHVLGDGMAMNVLVRELASLYSGRLSALQRRVTAIDYAISQFKSEKSTDFQQKKTFWKKILNRGADRKPLPLGRLTTGTLALRGEGFAKLTSFCTETGLTPFNVLLAAIGRTAMDVISQSNLVVQIVNSGRTQPEDMDFVGNLSTFVPIAIELEKGLSWAEFVNRIKHDWLEVSSKLPYPTGSLWHELEKRGPRIVVHFNVPDEEAEFGDLKATCITDAIDARPSPLRQFCDLFFSVSVLEDSIMVFVSSKEELVNAESFLARLRGILDLSTSSS